MRSLNDRRESGMTLVELMVATVIMGIITTMIIMTWISLTNSYSFNMKSARQREAAMFAMSRMSAEIRDAQAVQTSANPASFVRAAPDEIQFFTTFNTTGAANPTTAPRLVRYIYRPDAGSSTTGTVYREISANGTDFSTVASSEAQLENVVNAAHGQALFTYAGGYTSAGALKVSDGVNLFATGDVKTVTIALLVDLNPGHSPKYMDLRTTVQPRNTTVY